MRHLMVTIVLVMGCTEHGKGGAGSDGGFFPGDGGSGALCGGFGGMVCPPTEFCDFPDNSCGATDQVGACRPRPTGCPDNFDPVCGCDRVVHPNSCDAAAAGADLDGFGSCPLPPDTFKCGFKQSSLSAELCQVSKSDIGGEPDGFACQGLPTCGGQPSCSCLQAQQVPCADFACQGDAAQGLTVTCPGG
jgi:hypothetical protein